MGTVWAAFWRLLILSFWFFFVPSSGIPSLVLIGSILLSIKQQRPFPSDPWKRHWRLVVLQFMVWPAVILIGAVGGGKFWQNLPTRTLFSIATGAVYLLVLLSGGIGIYWIWKMKGLRWFAVSLSLLQFLFLSAAAALAIHSLIGYWD
jgi:hypothetical protein